MKDIMNLGYYLYNKWSLGESKKIFGKNLGLHVWERWNEVVRFGCGDHIYWFMNLDEGCRQKIVDRANELYNK